jgi:hypothetical protein
MVTPFMEEQILLKMVMLFGGFFLSIYIGFF